MKLSSQPSYNAAALLRVLEKKIITGSADAALLAVVQRKLDAMEQAVGEDSE